MVFIEHALLAACARKERSAQYQLYKQCYSFLCGICMRYMKNREDADAILNIGFLKVLNNLDKYNPEIPFTLWLRRIMINTVIDEYRKNKKEKETFQSIDFGEHHSDFDDHSINEFIRQNDAEYIHNMIRTLPPMSQRVFNLYAIDGFAHKEIAELLGMSEGTSKWHLNFARTRLKELMTNMMQPLKKVGT